MKEQQNTESYLLLIWENIYYESIPENLYLIPTKILSDKDLNILYQANGNYINDTEDITITKYLNIIHSSIRSKNYLRDEKGNITAPVKWRSRFVKYKVNPKDIIKNMNITNVIIAGFLE